MVKKASPRTRSSASALPKRRPKPEFADEQEQILRKATEYLICKQGMFLVATGIREVRIKKLRVWIIAVTLRYATGDEGYIGELLYDGEEFMFLTEQLVMGERAQKIADNPKGVRKWNEYRASVLHSGKA
jgi:hypothetical protein